MARELARINARIVDERNVLGGGGQWYQTGIEDMSKTISW